jgi:hypothetical protein
MHTFSIFGNWRALPAFLEWQQETLVVLEEERLELQQAEI